MRRTLAVPAIVLALVPGCTFVFGAAGGGIAKHRSEQSPARGGGSEGSPSLMPAVLAGAGVGMIVDALAIGFLIRAQR